MLKISKGLKQFVGDEITAYTDDKGNKYVRVKMGGEDFCIAAHDYTRDGKQKFTWNEAVSALLSIIMTGNILTMFSKKQVKIYIDNLDDINKKLEEIDGDILEDEWYWTLVERGSNSAWCFDSNNGQLYCDGKSSTHPVRFILNLLNQ